MSQWGNQGNNGANSVITAPAQVNKTANSTNQTALFNNTTPGAWKNNNIVQNMEVGQYGVTTTAKNSGNSTGSEANKIAHTGWVLRTQGMGPAVSYTINAGGSSYVNGAIFAFTVAGAASVNAHGNVTTNSTGGITSIAYHVNGLLANASLATFVPPANGIVSVTITASGGPFTNGDVVNFGNGAANAVGIVTTNATSNIASIAFPISAGRGFSNVTNTTKSWKAANGAPTGNAVTSAAASPGGSGYANTDVITFSNGVINAIGTPTTNSLGGITSIAIGTIGMGFPGATNTAVAVTNSTGGATLGSGATITPTLSATTLTVVLGAGASGNLSVIVGGRAGRVHYETLVATSSMVGAGSTQFPNT